MNRPPPSNEEDQPTIKFGTFAQADTGGQIIMDGVKFVGSFEAEKFIDSSGGGLVSAQGVEFQPTPELPKQRWFHHWAAKAALAVVTGLLVTVLGAVLIRSLDLG